MDKATTTHDIIVIGAGIIGISSALKLQAEGRQVLVLDRKGIAAETSSGNAGAFAFSDIIPLATPGIMRKAPKWLIDPLGPLTIPPTYALQILPWMLKFWRASWQDKYQASLTAQASLMALSKAALDRQIKVVKGESMIRHEGQLQLYDGKTEFEASLAGWQARKEQGVQFELLESSDAIATIQSGIHPRFSHGAFTPEWKNVCDPAKWTKQLAQKFIKLGGEVQTQAIESLDYDEESVKLSFENNALFAEHVVVATGAWSKVIAESVGDNFPLETERGYNTTLSVSNFQLKTHLTFANHGFVVSKIGHRIRVGGAVELGGLTLKPNFKRAEILLNKACLFLPDMKTTDAKQWMGFRPSMPDSLPVIGYSAQSKRIIYAFGHGHLGLTQSAGTAELVNTLVNGKMPPMDLRPFSPCRFG